MSLRTSEITVERFSFVCPERTEHGGYEKYRGMGIPYTLKIGNQSTKSYVSQWSNDMSRIRHQLETYCYERKAKIDLYFEDEPTVINLQHIDDFVKIVAQPNNLVKGTAVSGFCDERETIREIYEGLLNAGRVGYGFDGNHDSWGCDSIAWYNQMKSPVIERYVDNINNGYNRIEERQRVIHHIFTICPDYTRVFGQMTGQYTVVEVYDDDIVTLYENDSDDNEICSVILPGVNDWLSEFNRHSDGVESTMGTMNVEDWHRRGLILAKELRKLLPSDIDLWYGFPFEDEKHRYDRPILITDEASLDRMVKQINGNKNDVEDLFNYWYNRI